MATEYSPELNEEILKQLQKKIELQKQQDIASAKGAATTRGMAGSGWEGKQIARAQTSAMDAATQASLNMAMENAARMREERLLGEQRAYQTKEREAGQLFGREERIGSQAYGTGEREASQLFGKSERLGSQEYGTAERVSSQNYAKAQQEYQNQFNALEAEKQRAFAAGETVKAQQFQAQQDELQREFQAKVQGQSQAWQGEQASKQRKADIISGTVGSVGEAVGGIFCFKPSTLIEMADGTPQSMCFVELGDKTMGGQVVSIQHSLVRQGDMFDYKGTQVAGGHAVLENGQWIRVRESAYAKPTDYEGEVINFITSRHRIFSNGICFADDYESPVFDNIEMWDRSLEYLNAWETASCPAQLR
jgi:hypothetical protein